MSYVASPAPQIPPMLSGGLPLLGHVLDFRKRPVELFERGRREYGDYYSLQLPGSRTAVMSGLAAHEAFFRMPDDQGSMREVYQLMVPVFGKGVAYDATPEIMKEQLGFFFPALREARLRTYAAAIIEEAESFFSTWGDEGIVDLYDVGNELTIYTSSRCLLGKEFRQHLSHEFAELYQDLEAGLSVLAFFAPNAPTPAFRRRDQARIRMKALIQRQIDRRLQDTEPREDMLQALIDARYTDGRQLSTDEITGLLLALIFAGHHTSGVTFSWNQILLHQHPQYLAKVREEQVRIMGDKTEFKIEDVRAMDHLEWSLKETLRLYPPIIMVMRRVLKDLKAGNFVVPAGDMALVSPALSHRLPSIFPNPDRYDPERYGPGREEDKQHPLAHIAFGGGRHRCLGAVFATLQLVAASSVLLRNFELKLVETKYEPDYSRMLVGPRQPCRARFKRIRRAHVSPIAA